MEIKEKIKKMFGIDKDGSEILSKERPALPVGYQHPPTLEERMMQMIRGSLSDTAMEKGMESFDEANDFDVNDDDNGLFPDEDDKYTPNDPYMEEAAKHEAPERLKKASEAVKRLSEERVKEQRRTGKEDEIKAQKDDSNGPKEGEGGDQAHI